MLCLKRVSLFSNTNVKVLSLFPKFVSSDLKTHQSKVMGRGLPTKKAINGVKQIVLVSSGKGGVGKSTTSVNLAVALKVAFPDLKIGLLDCDVFGPSIPLMMNLHLTPLLNNDNLMVPLVNYGVECMSMGFLIEEGSPVIWRGLMVMQALDKLLRQVAWNSIDYLIIDTPPGTGDTLLSLIQNIPITGVVLVTTPQKAALEVTKRGAIMFKNLKVPIVGLVENMSTVKCSSCSENIKIFGNKTPSLASEINCEILQSFELDPNTSDGADNGLPIILKNPENQNSKKYLSLAKQLVNFLNKN